MMDMKQHVRAKLLRQLIDEMGGMAIDKFKPKPTEEPEEDSPVAVEIGVHKMDDEEPGDDEFMNRYKRMKASMGE